MDDGTGRDCTYVVSVGRALGTTAVVLPVEAWAELRSGIHSAIETTGAAVVFDGHGVGLHEGVAEDSATFVAVGDLSEEALARLRYKLADLARCYGQESIALTVGTTEFVVPATHRRPGSATDRSAPVAASAG